MVLSAFVILVFSRNPRTDLRIVSSHESFSFVALRFFLVSQEKAFQIDNLVQRSFYRPIKEWQQKTPVSAQSHLIEAIESHKAQETLMF